MCQRHGTARRAALFVTDPSGVHHFVACDVLRSVQMRSPRAAGMVPFVGMDLNIYYRNEFSRTAAARTLLRTDPADHPKACLAAHHSVRGDRSDWSEKPSFVDVSSWRRLNQNTWLALGSSVC
jgi:hypothetical protein